MFRNKPGLKRNVKNFGIPPLPPPS